VLKKKGWKIPLSQGYYGNSNISPRKNIIFNKTLLKETKILQDIIITL